MCDSFTIATPKGIWLAKNSDREPEEAQRVELIPAATAGDSIETTYTHVVSCRSQFQRMIIGRPDWMWGAEMGVNQAGVAIVNEAVFTRTAPLQRANPPRLLGMDLLRLALSQAQYGEEAIEILAFYLTRYGQGGPAGFKNKKFVYDNTYLISDSTQCWLVETVERDWVAKPVTTEAISNRLNIDEQEEAQNYGNTSPQKFAGRNTAQIMTWLSRAKTRQKQARKQLDTIAARAERMGINEMRDDLFGVLGSHQKSSPSNAGDICMHARGVLCPHETVNSMVAFLPNKGRPRVWMTGCSHPCQAELREIEWHAGHFFARHPRFWERQREQRLMSLYAE